MKTYLCRGRRFGVPVVRDILVDQDLALRHGGWVFQETEFGYVCARKQLYRARQAKPDDMKCITHLGEPVELLAHGLDALSDANGVMEDSFGRIYFIRPLKFRVTNM